MQIKLKSREVGDVEKKKPVHRGTVEEALDIAGFGRYNVGLVLICSWTLQAMGMDLFGSSFVVAAAVCDLDLTLQTRALLSATPLIGVVMGAQLWGYVSDTKGRKLTLVLSMSVGFVFAALSSIAPDWKTMAVLKLISSTFTSACNSAAYTLIGESCPAYIRGRVMLLASCMLMCSQACAAVFAFPILPLDFNYHISFLGIEYNYRPWRLLAFVMTLPCLATACLLQLYNESPKFLISRGRNEEALAVLKNMYERNTGDNAENFQIKKLVDDSDQQASAEGSLLKALWQQTAPLFKAPLLKDTLKLFYLVAIIYMTGSGFILWLPYIMNNVFMVLESGAGDGMNLCSIIRYSAEDSFISGNSTQILETCNDTIQETTLLSAIIYGGIASATNVVLSLTLGSRKRIAMMIIISSSALAAIFMNVVHIPIAGAMFFFLFLLCALAMGFLSVYFVELYPTSLRGMASCLSIMWGRTCAFVGVNVIGALFEANCEATFYGWAVLLMSTVVVAYFLPRDKLRN